MYLWSLAFIIDIIGHLNIVYSFNQCIACIFTEFKSMFVKYSKLFFIILIECVYYTQLCSNLSVGNRFVTMLHSQNIHHWNVPSDQTNKLRGNKNENIFAKIPNKKWTTTATAFIIKENTLRVCTAGERCNEKVEVFVNRMRTLDLCVCFSAAHFKSKWIVFACLHLRQ